RRHVALAGLLRGSCRFARFSSWVARDLYSEGTPRLGFLVGLGLLLLWAVGRRDDSGPFPTQAAFRTTSEGGESQSSAVRQGASVLLLRRARGPRRFGPGADAH